MRSKRRALARCDRGASAVEYGLLLAALAALVVAAVFGLGGFVQSAFQNTGDCLASSGVGASC